MKFTSEDLLKAMGLKVGQTLKFNHGIFKLVVSNKKNIIVLQSEHKDIGLGILIDEECEIIQPKPILTEDEKVILRNLDKKWKWIARNEWEDTLVLFTDKPIRRMPYRTSQEEVDGDGEWVALKGVEYIELRQFNHLFQFIKWEDEPYSIKELLGESK